MKKLIGKISAWITVTALLLAIMVTPISIGAAAEADFTIGRLDTAPKIDGVVELSEWGEADVQFADYHMSTIANGSKKVALDGQVWLGYDATHFYMAVVAEYDYHSNAYSGASLYLGDALQIQISANGRNERRGFTFALNDNGVSCAYQEGDYESYYTSTIPGGGFKVSRDNKNRLTVYEIALPITEFAVSETARFEEGGRIAMSFAMRMNNGFCYEWYDGIVETRRLSYAAQIELGGSKFVRDGALFGDVNGSGVVDSTDARMTLQYFVGSLQANDLDLTAADVDGNGAVDSTDARLILQYFVGTLDEFPGDNSTTSPSATKFGVTYTQSTSGNTFSPNSAMAGMPFEDIRYIETYPPADPEDEDVNSLCYFALTTDWNEGLPFNVRCGMNDEYISAMLPAGVDRSALIPTFEYYGGEILADGKPLISEVTALDLTKDVAITMTSRSGDVIKMTLRVETLDTGLPSVALTTEGFTEITSRDDYYTSTFYLGGADAGEGTIMTAQSRGRGNSSWSHPKKSYRVKLDEKAALLGMTKSKHWTLIANYEDKTLLRNTMAEYLAEATELNYVVQNRSVDLWYNGRYWGTYTLTEKIEVEGDRVNITKYEPGMKPGECGFLLEFDGHVNEVSESQKSKWQWPLGKEYNLIYDPTSGDIFMPISHYIVIQEPSTEELLNDPEQLRYIYDRVVEANTILRSGDYSRFDEVVDIDSFLWWGYVNEYMNNADSNFHSSCYMSLDVGGKFTMGPVWDFDRSSDNCDYWSDPSGMGTCMYANWLGCITSTVQGKTRMRELYPEFRPVLEGLVDYLYEMADTIYASQQYNFERWPMLEKRVNATKPDNANSVAIGQANSQTFESEIARLVKFFEKRATLMDSFMKYGQY